jgi:septal ring factor EnvC (AmiA/AmiB activator)
MSYDEIEDKWQVICDKPRKILSPQEQVVDLRAKLQRLVESNALTQSQLQQHQQTNQKLNNQVRSMLKETEKMKRYLETQLHESNGQIDNAEQRALSAEADVAEIKRKMGTMHGALVRLMSFFGWREENLHDYRALEFKEHEIKTIIDIIRKGKNIC